MAHDLVKLFVVSDGHGQDFWSLGLDHRLQINGSELDRALRHAGRMGQDTQLALSTVAASFGSCVGLVPVALADALQQVDDGCNVARHFFHVVHIDERPLSPVVAVAGNQKLRAQAAKLALCCRMAFEQDFLMVDPSAPVLCIDSPLGLELRICIARFMPSTGLPTTAQPGAVPEPENSGVWADPAEPSQKRSSSNKIQRPM